MHDMSDTSTNRNVPADHEQRMARARLSLEGLSLGDAFGEQFFGHYAREVLQPRRELPPGPWPWTDDTAMAVSIVDVLGSRGEIDQDDLAACFARRFVAEPTRGYGAGAAGLLDLVSSGFSWREVAGAMFRGTGSWGNGSAMRVAPVGAYFADDPAEAVRQARLSAVVTHAHPEGQAGAIAVAVAAAAAWGVRDSDRPDRGAVLMAAALEHAPDSQVRDGLRRAADLTTDDAQVAAAILGCGERISCSDTVPFCIWCAAKTLDSFSEAMWATASAHGDVDTTCAIVGGIVALATGSEGIPAEWLARREPLPGPVAC